MMKTLWQVMNISENPPDPNVSLRVKRTITKTRNKLRDVVYFIPLNKEKLGDNLSQLCSGKEIYIEKKKKLFGKYQTISLFFSKKDNPFYSGKYAI
jgi:hypothetical protein